MVTILYIGMYCIYIYKFSCEKFCGNLRFLGISMPCVEISKEHTYEWERKTWRIQYSISFVDVPLVFSIFLLCSFITRPLLSLSIYIFLDGDAVSPPPNDNQHNTVVYRLGCTELPLFTRGNLESLTRPCVIVIRSSK